MNQTGLLRDWKAVPHMPAHGAKDQARGHKKEEKFWVDRQEERGGPTASVNTESFVNLPCPHHQFCVLAY